MTASVIYRGNLRCEAIHLQSNSKIETDAPTDNHGQGARFSPTDLLCVSLASCMLTTIGIKAEEMGINMSGACAEVTKFMASNPRRVARIDVEITLPEMHDNKTRLILERTGNHCPVAKSLHSDIVLNLHYVWA